jgi:hypothetical protein
MECAVRHRLLIVVGLVLLVGGGIGAAAVKVTKPLSTLVVAIPIAGMTPTAEGNGGATATHTFAGGANTPVTPFRYLKPVPETINGAPAGNQSAFWKVWWNKATGEIAVTSLAQHVNASDAQGSVTSLNSGNSHTASFNQGSLVFTSDTPLTVPAIPGALGYQLRGTVHISSGPAVIDVDMAVFSRGAVTALLTVLNANTPPEMSAFVSFAQAQYKAMAPPTALTVIRGGLIVLAVAGGVLVLVAYISGRRRSRVAAVASPPWTGAPAGGPGAPPWQGAPPPGEPPPWQGAPPPGEPPPRAPPWQPPAPPEPPSPPGS